MIISFEAKAFSRGRAAIMSVATALILWFHVDMPVESAAWRFLKTICDIGVDMFLLASGMGIYFAVRKYASYGSYIFSRFRRILPAFLIVSIPWYAHKQWGVGNGDAVVFLKQISTLSFWLDGDWSCWYVPAILSLYVLTPLIMRAWDRWNWMGAAAFVGAIVFAMVVQHTHLIVYMGSQLIFLGRVPAYIIGLCLGKAIQEKRVFRIPVPLLVGILAVSVYVMLSCCGYTSVTIPWAYRYFAYLPVMLSISMVCTKLPSNFLVSSLGAVSLECYLLFEKIQLTLLDQSWMWPLTSRGDYYRPLVALILTLPAAAALRWLCSGGWLCKQALDKTAGKR